MKKIFVLILLMIPLLLNARTFKGLVKDEGGKPLPGVSVMLKGTAGRIRAYAITAKTGAFTLKYEGEDGQADSLVFRSMGYATVTLAAKTYKDGRTITMREEAFALKEVKVKPDKITQRGDTIDYLVSSFRQKNDRSIADVISRMPGMEVGKDGSITYQGKSINKFYIEGMDLMGSKYGVASNNIDAGKVKKVQVMENHQPVKTLKDVVFSDQAALNIVLDEKVKDMWQGELSLAGGATLQGKTDALYDSRALAMLFSRKMQSISMYKCNNTGKDISSEVGSLASLEESVPAAGGLLSGIGLGRTGLDESRTMFNNTHILATNWLFKTAADNDLRLQLTGLFDKSLERQQSQTVYTDLGSRAVITQDNDARAYRNEYEGELMYKVNKDRLYLVNTLKGYADFNRSLGTSVLNGQTTQQSVRPRERYVADNLRFIKNFSGGNSFSLSSAAAYHYKPGTLLISDGSAETLKIGQLDWKTYTNFRHRLWLLNITYTVGFDLKRQNIDVENAVNTATDKYDEYRVYVSPDISIKTHDVSISLNVPINWRYRSLNSLSAHKFTADPSLYFSYEPTARWQLTAGGSYSWMPQDALTSMPTLVFTDYITARRGNGQLDYIDAFVLNAAARYKNVISGFFANGGIVYSRMGNMLMYKGELVDNVYCSTPSDQRSSVSMITLNGSASKSFDWAGLLLKLSARQTWNNYSMLINDNVQPFRMENSEIKLNISIKPLYWLSADLTSSLNRNHQANRNGTDRYAETLCYYTHKLRTYIMPGNWIIELDNEMYHSNDESVSTTLFSDLSITYKTRHIEIGAACHNLFGKDLFERRYFTDTQRIYTSTRLRPREILFKVRFSL